MTRAQRLKWLIKIGVETYELCGGAVKIVACIEQQAIVEMMLTSVNRRQAGA